MNKALRSIATAGLFTLLATSFFHPLAAAASWQLPSGVTVDVDCRVQLLSVVQALAERSTPGAGAAEYRKRFKAFRGHPAVLRYVAWAHAGVPAAVPMEALLGASTAYIIEVPLSYLPSSIDALGGPGAVEAFISELRDLDAKAEFAAYCRSRTSENRRAVDEALAELALGVPIGTLEAYLGTRYTGRFQLIIAPDYFGRGRMLKATLWSAQSMVHVQFRNVDKWCSTCAPPSYQLAGFGSSLAHELTHRMLKPPAGAQEELEASIGPPPSGCGGEPPGWKLCLDEHVVMAVEYRLRELTDANARDPDGAARLKLVPAPYLKVLLKSLRDYEGARARYRTLQSYYPRLIAAMKSSGRI